MGDLVPVVPQLEHLLVVWALEVVQLVGHGVDLGGEVGKSTSKSSESEHTSAAALPNLLLVLLPLPAPLPLPFTCVLLQILF